VIQTGTIRKLVAA